ncbi:MAG: DUF11 domain-containing protein [Victivallales bacterium]|nr:DUF11 domain-containing protein [Victivallales bacterium]
MKSKFVRVLSLALTAVLFAGCACMEPTAAAPRPKSKPVVSGTCPVITTADGKTTAAMAIPTGNVNSSIVLLTTTTPTEVYVGESVDYEMCVKNLTDCPLTDVILTAEIPENFKFLGSIPQAEINANNEAKWDLSRLAGGQSKCVKVRGIPTKAGDFITCAKVEYKPILCTSFVAVAPKLALKKTMPANVMKCDPIPITLVVSNAGTGTLRNVTLVDTLPAGLTTADGRTQVTFPIGSLAAGQSVTKTINAKATRTGTFTNKAVATAGKLTAEDAATVKVTQPVLGITKTATTKAFAGRGIVYDIKVTNKGDAPANNLIVTDVMPAGAAFVSASSGGMASAGKVVWKVASLAPKATVAFKVTAKAVGAGTLKNQATAVADCAAAVSDAASTLVAGKAAILLEVIDVADPLSVGDVETYTITATNQGTAPDTNIKIVCTLEANEVFQSAAGPAGSNVTGSHKAGVITFTPLRSLAPKARAAWQVKVKGVKVGDVRFAVEMTTDELKRPVNETEATQIY